MTSGAEGEWVRQGTPRDDNADWNEEQSEYGTAVSPTEWDDYSTEQSVPVAAPRAQAAEGVSTASSADSPAERESEAVPGQEPDTEKEYRSEDPGDDVADEPAGDADDSGVDPARIDDVTPSGSTAVIPAPMSPVDVEEASYDEVQDGGGQDSTRPRPIVPDASNVAVGAVEPVDIEETDSAGVDGGQDEADGDVVHHDEADGDVVHHDEADGDVVHHDEAAQPDDEDEHHGQAAEYVPVDPVEVPTNHVESPAEVVEQQEVTAPEPDVDSDGAPAVASPADDVDEYDARDASDDEATTVVETDDVDATQAVPVFAAVAPGTTETAATGAVPAGLYRAHETEHTTVIEPAAESYPDVDVEEERLQARLEAERQARDQRLGAVPTSSNNATREDLGTHRVTTDRFFPSLGLFVLRLVTAGILGVTSWQILGSGVDRTANFLGGYPLIPEPRLVAWILGFTLGALALLLVIGLLQRVVGVLLLAVAVASLVLIRWGSFSIFDADVAGFMGDKDLLLAAVGLLLFSMGGGKWGIDGAFRGARAASKAEREN